MRLFYVLATFGMLFCLCTATFAKHQSRVHISKHAVAHHTSQPQISQINGIVQLANELNYLVNSNNSDADIAVYVKSMEYGDSLYARNINQPLTPASTLKIFTAEAALIYLGSE